MATGDSAARGAAPNCEVLPGEEQPHEAQPTEVQPTEVQLRDAPRLYNRIHAVIEHIPWYGFRTQVRLAQDSGVSEAAISRLLRGESQPSLVVALQVAQAVEKRLGRRLDVRELFSLDGQFPTAFPCQLAGCPNCLPDLFYDEADALRRECRDVRPGQWSLVQAHHASHHVAHHSITQPQRVFAGQEAA